MSGRETRGQEVGSVDGAQSSRQHPRRTRKSRALEGEAQVQDRRKGSGKGRMEGQLARESSQTLKRLGPPWA